MLLQQAHLEALIVSVLAVNAYGLEKAYALLPAFRKSGLTDPRKVAMADVEDVMMRLYEAGYRRGMLAEMMAGRLISLMKVVEDGKLDALNALVVKGDQEGTKALLCMVKGIGPKVAADVWMLATTK
jgi:hypothetical protein